ncbi:MAG: inner membrane CreD family protein [Desulfomonile tiedjei]|nr:inner membrane CreD family protein [Desulfomonile tiedjei]
MMKRIYAIVFIYLCTAATWIALGTTVDKRTEDYDKKLRGAVGELWGTKLKQEAPAICTNDSRSRPYLQASNLDVDLSFEPRQKGLLWYSTYRVKFGGRYQVINPTESPISVTFKFELPSQKAIYDDVRLLVGGQAIPDLPIQNGKLTRELSLAPGQTESVEVGYVTSGMDEWWYDFGSSVNQIKNFSLTMNTDFAQVDFPENSISPTSKKKTDKGWQLQWTYTNLLSSVKIGMEMPHKLNPGPWVSQVSFAAPISLFLFFFVLFLISTVKQVRIHPINYFFIGASFFSFHLLLAYLVDHISIHAAFVIASVVSVALVISYMRLVVGKRFAFLEVGISQFVFLVLFSYSFFFKGYTGLAITVLCIATLFLIMQITARLDWDALFSKESPPSPRDNPGDAQPAL